jgi:hypothetical protein
VRATLDCAFFCRLPARLERVELKFDVVEKELEHVATGRSSRVDLLLSRAEGGAAFVDDGSDLGGAVGDVAREAIGSHDEHAAEPPVLDTTRLRG